MEREVFSLFQTPLTDLLKNKLLLQKHYHLQEISIDSWPFWMFEENIKISNSLSESPTDTVKQENQFNRFAT